MAWSAWMMGPFDVGEDVALADGLAKLRHAGGRGDHAAAADALDQAAPVRVGDDLADQAAGRLDGGRLGDGGPDFEDALGRLGHEHRPVGHPLRGVGPRHRHGRVVVVVLAAVGEREPGRDEDQDSGGDQGHRSTPATSQQQAHPETDGEDAEDPGLTVPERYQGLPGAVDEGTVVVARQGLGHGIAFEARNGKRPDEEVVADGGGDRDDDVDGSGFSQAGRGHDVGAGRGRGLRFRARPRW